MLKGLRGFGETKVGARAKSPGFGQDGEEEKLRLEETRLESSAWAGARSSDVPSIADSISISSIRGPPEIQEP